MAIRFRPAERADSPALARFSDLAARAHTAVGSFDLAFPGPPGPTPERLAVLEALTRTETIGWLHWSLFRVAEVDGRVAAGVAGYAAAAVVTDEQIRAVLAEIGWNAAEIESFYRRLAPVLPCLPPPPPGAWTIDHVAALPEHRGQGLVSTLLEQVLGDGRARGCRCAQLDVLLGNDAARRIYERAGFRGIAEHTHPDCERALGSPGFLRMAREPI